MMNTRNKGFTLIELLVVIAIIGILSSVVLASLNSAREKSRDARRVADINQMRVALELYFDGNSGSYPADLATLSGSDAIPTVPVDPLDGSDYSYWVSSDGTNYHLGAVLEDSGHSALDGDVDADTSGETPAGFDGDSTDCAGTAGDDQCYDIQP